MYNLRNCEMLIKIIFVCRYSNHEKCLEKFLNCNKVLTTDVKCVVCNSFRKIIQLKVSILIN